MPHMNINPMALVEAIPYLLVGLFILIMGWVIFVTIADEPDQPAPPERE